ncbi:MAG TPA: hypothetical protein VF765_18770 [Polyangiaceae bacterium]
MLNLIIKIDAVIIASAGGVATALAANGFTQAGTIVASIAALASVLGAVLTKIPAATVSK